MPSINIRPFQHNEALAVANWVYEPPFDLYNSEPQLFGDFLVIDEEGYGYYAIVTDDCDDVIGFCCFGAEARVSGQEHVEGVIDIGGGVRPDRLSAGIATAVFPAIIDFAREKFNPSQFRTAVASFNERSTRLCISAGFKLVRRFEGPGREFCELVRSA